MLPLVPLRFGLPMVHERSIASRSIAETQTVNSLTPDCYAARYGLCTGHHVSPAVESRVPHKGKCTTNHGTVLHRVSMDPATS
jgi:hypothetical protein